MSYPQKKRANTYRACNENKFFLLFCLSFRASDVWAGRAFPSAEVGEILLACYRGNKGRREGKFHCRPSLFEEEEKEKEKTGSFSF